MKHKIFGFALMALLVIGVYVFAESIREVVVDSKAFQYISSKVTAETTAEQKAGQLISKGIEIEQRDANNQLISQGHMLMNQCIDRELMQKCVDALNRVMTDNPVIPPETP